MSQQVLDVLKAVKGYRHVPLGGLRALLVELVKHLRQIHGEPDLVLRFARQLADAVVADGPEPAAQSADAEQVDKLKAELASAAEELATQVADAVAKHAELQAKLDSVTVERDAFKNEVTQLLSARDALQAKLTELSKTAPDAPAAQPTTAEVDRSTTGQAAA